MALQSWLHTIFNSGEECLSGSPAAGSSSNYDLSRMKQYGLLVELYCPPHGSADMDVVFFHGLLQPEQGTTKSDWHIRTWTSGCSEKLIWPAKWLAAEFPNARILTMSYDGGQGMDLFNVGENAMWTLDLANVGRARPVILVGHSLGGIVIKEIVVRADKERATKRELEAFLKNIGGIFFISTPHFGLNVDAFRYTTSKALFERMFREVNIFSSTLSRLHGDFLRLPYPWDLAGVCETLPTDLGKGRPWLVVEEASARLCFGSFMTLNEDHFSICRPKTETSSCYLSLLMLINKVRENKLGHRSMPGDIQIVPREEVGLKDNSARREFERIRKQNFRPVVGFWGMGGIGKTTLCKDIFMDLHRQFEFTLFYENVKEVVPSSEGEVEEKVKEKFHHRGKKLFKNTYGPIWAQIEGQMLVVLDNVEAIHLQVVEKLRRVAADSSCFILTSSNKHVLHQVKGLKIVEVKCLSPSDSEILFKRHGFSDGVEVPTLSGWQDDYTKQIVKLCDGLPLGLEVLGRYLRRRNNREIWKSVLSKLSELDVEARLRATFQLSFDALEAQEQDMFLDAASVFQSSFTTKTFYAPTSHKGGSNEVVMNPDIYVLPTHGERRYKLGEAKALWERKFGNHVELYWNVLVERAMVIDVSNDSEIRLHELLGVFGKRLASERSHSSRFYVEYDVAHSKVLYIATSESEVQSDSLDEKIRGCKDVRALDVKATVSGKRVQSSGTIWDKVQQWWAKKRGILPSISPDTVAELHNLNYLNLLNCTITGSKVDLPRNLLLLTYERTLTDDRKDEPEFGFSKCANLFSLTLFKYGAKSLDPSISSLKRLQFIVVEADNLETLPEEFRSLEKLVRCELHCRRLTRLPDSFGDLKNLNTLMLHCKLRQLPGSFDRLEKLEYLHVQNSTALEPLPGSIFQLRSLQSLTVCTVADQLYLFVESSHLCCLRALSLSGQNLPNSFVLSFENLQVLTLQYVKMLPDSIGNLASLREMALISSEIKQLPKCFGDLVSLRYLFLESTHLLTLPDSFEQLNSLEVLILRSEVITTLPEAFGSLRNLRVLELKCCNLQKLPDTLPSLRSLQRLALLNCQHLLEIPSNFHEMQHLVELYFSPCKLPTSLRWPTLSTLVVHFDREDYDCISSDILRMYLNTSEILQMLKKEYFSLVPEGLSLLPCVTGDQWKVNDQDEWAPKFPIRIYQKFPAGKKVKMIDPRTFEFPGRKIVKIVDRDRVEIAGEIVVSHVGNLKFKLEEENEVRMVDLSNCSLLDRNPVENIESEIVKIGERYEALEVSKKAPILWSAPSSAPSVSAHSSNFREWKGSLLSTTYARFIDDPFLQLKPPSGQFRVLQKLRIWKWPHLYFIYDDLFCDGPLHYLKELEIGECDSLVELPESIGLLKNLEKLSICACPKLETLPRSLAFLRSLVQCNLRGLPSLRDVPTFESRVVVSRSDEYDPFWDKESYYPWETRRHLTVHDHGYIPQG